MANNEYVNKVVYGDKTLIDITDTNFDVEKLPLGSVAYAASGERVVGKAIVHNVYSDTTANWNSKVTYVPEDGDIIIYIDKSTIEEGGSVKNVPGIKIGDGNAYCVDLPFVADDIAKEAGKTNKYEASDSQFLFNNAGLTVEWSDFSDVIKQMNIYYGLDNANAVRLFNTLVAQVTLPMDFKVSAAFGLKTVKSTDAADKYNKDENTKFGFALGVAKQIKRVKSPILYAQFVYNMDPYKKFGDGQDGLALNGANVSDRWDGKGVGGIDAVDYFDGYAAIRGGVRWEF